MFDLVCASKVGLPTNVAASSEHYSGRNCEQLLRLCVDCCIEQSMSEVTGAALKISAITAERDEPVGYKLHRTTDVLVATAY